ncbi:serine protease HTR4 [Schistocerca serialis cubense]|uniref:serine protease HTR4 n=1 Tax=Schistocerca gregaria TaxID=7010 RepID=UPI00211E1080|nr:serine protease HTR4 [Schistocerca gregaria]XP_049947731.1 serine protease HTR4 [Schistocerca serialis cubense]
MRSRLQLQVVLAVLAAPAWAALLVAAPGPACVCSPAECEPVAAAECPGGAGTVWDACGCCRVCARAEAQPCGGPYGFYGSCGPGLLCVLQPGRPPLRSADGVCTRPPSLDPPAGCPGAAVRVSGCNVVERRCQCALAAACPGERPFAYSSYSECQLNLDYLLANELAEEQQGLVTTESPGDTATPGGR